MNWRSARRRGRRGRIPVNCRLCEDVKDGVKKEEVTQHLCSEKQGGRRLKEKTKRFLTAFISHV